VLEIFIGGAIAADFGDHWRVGTDTNLTALSIADLAFAVAVTIGLTYLMANFIETNVPCRTRTDTTTIRALTQGGLQSPHRAARGEQSYGQGGRPTREANHGDPNLQIFWVE
jgi:hypothetical protein